MGADAAWLGASEMGAGLYRRIGFEALGSALLELESPTQLRVSAGANRPFRSGETAPALYVNSEMGESPVRPSIDPRDHHMSESVYRVTEVIGISSESWEAAARNAVATAAKTVRDLRVAEVIRQDLTIQEGGVVNFRVRLGMSFKYDSGD